MWYSLKKSLGSVNLKGCKGISSGTSVLDRSDVTRCDVVIYYETTVLRDDLSEASPPSLFPFDYTIPVRVAKDFNEPVDGRYRCEILDDNGGEQVKVRFWLNLTPGQRKSDFVPDTV